MRKAWVGISAAAACAAMAIILLSVGNLETLSWIAGAGSFIIAVPSLVIALTTQSRTTGGSTTRPNWETGTGDSGRIHRPDTGTDTAAGNSGSVLVELTTPRIRAENRLSEAGQGATVCFLAIAAPATVFQIWDSDTLKSPTTMWLLAAMTALGAVMGWFNGTDGKDLLIINKEGLTIVDKRRIRISDFSFMIPWPLMERVRLVSSTNGAFHVLIVKFRRTKSESSGARSPTPKRRRSAPWSSGENPVRTAAS
ncbi:hypothetical protein [Saccharothrix obliqua]|uniref:hypothetical protein n=1 Tax=Saccharothrix obliqua TaxID=2861747 RepID=UPI001C5F2EFD|nr:hypothetical protein [Saccharothrix obliqua]MBW4722453.1 hypothetical protein [Saccharothrix obliqua]